MRTTQLTTTLTAAFLIAGLTACAAPAIEVEFDTDAVVETPAATPAEEEQQGNNTWSLEVMTGDIIQDLPEAEMAALTELSARLDATVPSALGVGITAGPFTPGEIKAQVILKDADSMIPAGELVALLGELKAYTGSEVVEWTIDAKEMVDGTYIAFDDVAAEAGLPADMIGNWGDLVFTPAQVAAFN